MSKYIIDLRPDCKVVQQICASNENVNVGARSVGLLDELTDDYVKKNFKDLLEGEYQKGFEDGKKEAESSDYIKNVEMDAFNKGMLFKEEKINDAFKRGFEKSKAQAERGCKGCEYEGKTGEHLPCEYCKNNFRSQWTAKDDKIEVGDTVNLKDGSRDNDGIVTKSWDNDRHFIMWADGSGGVWDKEYIVKTGRHFDIKSILEDMRHD